MKMKMINRLVSAAIAACMSLTMFAGAANLDTADASKTETLTGTASVVKADGVVDTQFEYTVPVDATKEERAEIARQAAKEAAGLATVGRAARGESLLAAGANVPLRMNRWYSLTASNFKADGGYVEITMSDIEDSTTVRVELNNAVKSKAVRNSDAIVVFYDQEYIKIYQGNPVSVAFQGTPTGVAGIVSVYQVY